ncbi:phosphomannomutase, putative [Hepatocystis sp. ex Piliocolobus tephrosceles]|nr:phosphomannomutase, putative [Hepatocystis sp. ex Piliocolobus tephrosceles]
MVLQKGKKLFLFDVDGTLTKATQKIEQDMVDALLKLKCKEDCSIGLVGGSDYEKIIGQIKCPEMYDYIFPENGVLAYKQNQQFFSESIIKFLGEEKLQELINYCLVYISNLKIPKKRGTFVELRNGIINISPIGRNCNCEERKEFVEYNAKNNILQNFRKDLMNKFSEFNLKFSIGGQISIDCFPIGWDKTFCLRHVENLFNDIYFFGDKTHPGGNDYEIFNDKRVHGYSVSCPNDTIEIISKLLYD